MAVERSRSQEVRDACGVGPASPARPATAAPHARRPVDRVYGALRSVMRGGTSGSPSAGMTPVAPCVSLGIRAMSTWPEARARLDARKLASMAELPALAGEQPSSAMGRVVIGQSLTVWDGGER